MFRYEMLISTIIQELKEKMQNKNRTYIQYDRKL